MSGWDFLLAELASGRLPLEPCKRLGKQLAQLHQVLASGDTGSAFCSFIDSEYSLRCLHRIRRLEEQLSAALESPPPKGTHLAVWEDARNRWNESLLAWEARLTPLLQTTGATIVSRVHGDLHLGQLLLNKSGDWRFMDFEGEPLRSLEERRLCDSPLRDVAGICRSLAYATAVAHAPERCEQMLRDAFLSEWTSQSSHLTKHSPTLLEALVREKNIYEVLYEIRHRPAWLHIPLRNL
jgi:predicted trehalose synthase